MFGNLFNELAILLMFSILFGFIAVRLYQPLILAFIAAGIFLGPNVLGWISASAEIDLLAKIGVTLLLFIVGLKLDFYLIRSLGIISIATGLGQVIFTSAMGYGLCIALGLNPIAAIYVAVALTFSSTIIIVKLLSDKNEIDTLHGRIAIGYLIVQDIVVIIAIVILSSLHLGMTSHLALSVEIFSLAAKGIGILTVVALLARFVLPKIMHRIAKSRELLILFAITWAIVLAGAADFLGLSKEVGGFLAGVSLASTHYRDALTSRLETLRNFLLLFFFLDLGIKLQFSALYGHVLLATVLIIFVLIIKPLIMMIIMGVMGYRKRTGFIVGLTSAQISEFSLIFVALGQNLKHIDASIVGLVTFIGIATFALSTYMILYSHTLYSWFFPLLTMFERKKLLNHDVDLVHDQKNYDAIVFGIGRYGQMIAKILRESGLTILGVDFDPQKIRAWKKNNFPVRFGDAEDMEFTKTLPVQHTKWVISTIPKNEPNQILMKSLKENNFSGKVVLSVFDSKELSGMQKINPDLILFPYKDAAAKAAQRLAKLIGFNTTTNSR